MNVFNQRAAQEIYLVQRAAVRRRTVCNSYARYEARKQEWITLHPGATSDEYQRAMTAIAREVGI
jgi:hypothetical protein